MPLRSPALYVMAGALLAACASPATPPPTDSIDFARGCWISRVPAESSNPQTTTIRLLPSRTGAARLEGELLIYNQQPAYPPLSTPLSIDLDARHAARGTDTFTAAPAPTFLALPEKGWTRLSFSSAPPDSQGEIKWLFIEGDGEHLKLSSGLSVGLMSGVSFDFQGARDGCD